MVAVGSQSTACYTAGRPVHRAQRGCGWDHKAPHAILQANKSLILNVLRLDHKAPHAILVIQLGQALGSLRLDHKAPHAILDTHPPPLGLWLRLDHKAPHAILSSVTWRTFFLVAVGSQSTACYTEKPSPRPCLTSCGWITKHRMLYS